MSNIVDTDARDSAYQLSRCTSNLEFRQAFEHLRSYRTPAELQEVIICLSSMAGDFSRTDMELSSACICGSRREAAKCCEYGAQPLPDGRALSTAMSSSSLSMIDRTRLNATIIGELAADLRGSQSAFAWQRIQKSTDIIHYTSIKPVLQQKTLIVGLTGKAQRLMMPTYRWLQNLDAAQYDLILFRDRTGQCFNNGADGCVGSIHNVANYIHFFAEEGEYDRKIAIGTSGGALPAIFIGSKSQFEKVIAIGPASPAKHSTISSLLSASLADPPPSLLTQFIVSFSSRIAADVDAAQQVLRLVPNAILEPEPRAKTHNVIFNLYELGLFPEFLDRHVKAKNV